MCAKWRAKTVQNEPQLSGSFKRWVWKFGRSLAARGVEVLRGGQRKFGGRVSPRSELSNSATLAEIGKSDLPISAKVAELDNSVLSTISAEIGRSVSLQNCLCTNYSCCRNRRNQENSMNSRFSPILTKRVSWAAVAAPGGGVASLRAWTSRP